VIDTAQKHLSLDGAVVGRLHRDSLSTVLGVGPQIRISYEFPKATLFSELYVGTLYGTTAGVSLGGLYRFISKQNYQLKGGISTGLYWGDYSVVTTSSNPSDRPDPLLWEARFIVEPFYYRFSKTPYYIRVASFGIGFDILKPKQMIFTTELFTIGGTF